MNTLSAFHREPLYSPNTKSPPQYSLRSRMSCSSHKGIDYRSSPSFAASIWYPVPQGADLLNEKSVSRVAGDETL